jgi:hypothetical protein
MVLVLGLLVLAAQSPAEFRVKVLSVTATSQTYLLPTPQDAVGLCNYGTNHAYYRLFWDGEIPAVATASAGTNNVHKLPAGTATAPYCLSVDRTATQPAPWRAISIICDTAESATVHLESF